jgi:serine/threonine-protein kinase
VLLAKLGEGGMGSVYAARHATTNHRAAVKLLNANGPTSRQRFEREVRLTRLLDHPHTIRIYDHGVSGDGRLYYAMECVDGVSLSELVGREGPQTPERVIHLLHQLAAALAAVHRVGLVHRDITPGNILLGRHAGAADWVRVLDFGLAKELGTGEAVRLTATNCVTGTPAYLAPEMITAPDRVDGRADIYGVGGVAYFLLTGTPPFSGATALEVCAHHVHTLPEPPSERCRRAIPRSLEHLVLACLSKQPEQRPAEASRLEQELLGLARAHPWDPPSASAKGWRSAA